MRAISGATWRPFLQSPAMRGASRARNVLVWTMVAVLVTLFLSCSRPADSPLSPCTISVRAGESIQAVLDSAPPGAVICLPAGTWTESLRVTKPVTLQGAGPRRTRVVGAQLGQPVIHVHHEEGEVRLLAIGFSSAQGSCPDPAGCAHGLLSTGDSRVLVRDCSFSENARDGVHAREGSYVSLTGVTCSKNGGYALAVHDRAGADVVASSLTQSRAGGIWLAGLARLRVVRSSVSGSGGPGIWVRDDASLSADESRVTDSRGHGLWVRDRGAADLTGCTIDNSYDMAVFVEHQARAHLTDCSIRRSLCAADVRGSSEIRLAGCTLRELSWDGIRLGGSSCAQILGCTIAHGKGSGIRITGQAQAEISQNRIELWKTYGILCLASSPPWGNGNRFSGNGVDLAGNLPGELREPSRAPSLHEARFPDSRFQDLQQAVDALLPGGLLVIEAGVYIGGVTVAKPVRVEADGAVLLTGRSGTDAPVMSLVGGADLELVGVSLGYGSEGLILGSDARASLVHCVLSDNLEGLRAADSSRASLVHCRVSRNERGGMWLWGQAQADVEECVFTQNGIGRGGVDGPSLGVGAAAQLRIVRSTIAASGRRGAILLRDSASAVISENSIRASSGWGIVLESCTQPSHQFTGRVEGGNNVFTNNTVDLCPAELAFLSSERGELNFRR